MLPGMVILFFFLSVGEILSQWLKLPIPGNVIGMTLLLLALVQGWVKVEWIKEAAEGLLSNLGMLFVPAGVGVMLYFDLIGREWLPILAATFISTFVVMAVTGWAEQAFDAHREESQ